LNIENDSERKEMTLKIFQALYFEMIARISKIRPANKHGKNEIRKTSRMCNVSPFHFTFGDIIPESDPPKKRIELQSTELKPAIGAAIIIRSLPRTRNLPSPIQILKDAILQIESILSEIKLKFVEGQRLDIRKPVTHNPRIRIRLCIMEFGLILILAIVFQAILFI